MRGFVQVQLKQAQATFFRGFFKVEAEDGLSPYVVNMLVLVYHRNE